MVEKLGLHEVVEVVGMAVVVIVAENGEKA